MSDTRTGPLVAKLVEGIQGDIADAIEGLASGLAKMRALEGHARGVNGLAATLKAKGAEVQLIINVLQSESESVAKKMLGAAREPITERVDTPLVIRVKDARRESDEREG